VQQNGTEVRFPAGLAHVHRLEERAFAGDAVGVAGDVVEADGLHGPSPPRVDPSVGGLLHEPLGGQLRQESGGGLAGEGVLPPGVEGQLCHGAQELPREDVGVRQVDDGLLVGLSEEGPGVLHQVLIERVLEGHEHGQGLAVAPARTARLLPGGKDRPGVSRDDHAVERADVDAHLERVGRRHPREQAPL